VGQSSLPAATQLAAAVEAEAVWQTLYWPHPNFTLLKLIQLLHQLVAAAVRPQTALVEQMAFRETAPRSPLTMVL
jgi:hypothetical protein